MTVGENGKIFHANESPCITEYLQSSLFYKLQDRLNTDFDYSKISKARWGVPCAGLATQEMTFLLISSDGI